MVDLKKELPEVFNDFADSRKNAFLKVKEIKDKNVPIIGIFCTFFPQELAVAAGATCVSLCATSDETIQDAERDLPKNLCPLIKSSYGFALTDKCPFFYFSDLVVGETTCDGKKKMYEYLGEFKPVHVMELPNKNTEQGLILWKEEIRKMIKTIEDLFGVEITEEKLKHAIDVKNAERSAVKDFYSIMKADDLPITGEELKAKVMSEHKHISGKPRILITGCPIGGATEKVIEAVENNGAVVVSYENCGGAKAIDENVDVDNPDMIDAIARKYMNIGCACVSPNENRLKLLNKLIDEYKVDGVIDMHLQACTPYQVEGLSIKRFCNDKKNVPYIAVETDYSKSDIGQLNTRIGAFIEML